MDAQKLKAYERLKQLLNTAGAASPAWNNGETFEGWRRAVKTALRRLFNEKSEHIEAFDAVRYTPLMFSLDANIPAYLVDSAFMDGMAEAKVVIRSALDEFEDYEMNEAAEAGKRTNGANHKKNNGAVSKRRKLSKDIFIVHGHDNEMKLDAEQTLKELRLKPVILHKRPSRGKTLIEKFEKNANVQFAVVLLSDEDIGYAKADGKTAARPRPRQNVILELGYFIGRLGRDRVLALKRGNIELPTDFSGVVYTAYDSAGAWKTELARELRAAGYPVDANSLI